MKQLMRFGRRVPLPSTVQIVHELLVAQRNDDAQRASAAKDAAGKGDHESGPPHQDTGVPSQG